MSITNLIQQIGTGKQIENNPSNGVLASTDAGASIIPTPTMEDLQKQTEKVQAEMEKVQEEIQNLQKVGKQDNQQNVRLKQMEELRAERNALSVQIENLLIEELLGKLDDESLKRSHKSLLFSFSQMLKYIDDIGKPVKQDEIRLLLQTYRDMAVKFYTQYELSILKEIDDQRSTQKQSEIVIRKIERLKNIDAENNDLKTAIPLLQKAYDDAKSNQENLIKNFPTLMQDALDKLRDEWQRLNTIATASATLTEDEELIRTLMAVATAASLSVELEPTQMLIVPGNAFALYSFSYLDNFAVLTVPIYSVYAPWEWSIFWHELAGYKVGQLENASTVNGIREKLTEFHVGYKNMKETDRNELLKQITRNSPSFKGKAIISNRKNEYGLNYLNNIFSEDILNLQDLGGFEHQFEQILAKAIKGNKFQSYEEIKEQGWCVDWFKELFEDACSVLAIREPFVDFFQDILSRHAVTDKRHPPANVRLNVAEELLKLMDSKYKIRSKSTRVEKFAAKQILKFMSLLMAASPIFDSPTPNMSRSFDYNQVMEKLFLYRFPELVGTRIGASIQNWLTNFLGANNQTNDINSMAKGLIRDFSDQELAEFINYLKDEIRIKPSYEILLAGKEYKQLLALSFYKRDLFSSRGITNVFYNKDGIAASSALFPDTSDTDFIIDAFGLLFKAVTSSADGEVTFDFSFQKWATTRNNWNMAFPADSPLPNIKKYNIQ